MANYTTIQIRRDVAANWSIKNPILAAGEFGYEADTVRLKIGDGLTAWNFLPYFNGGGAAGSGSVTSVGVASGDLDVSNSPITSSGSINLALKNTGVSAGVYGSTSSVPVITVDSKGRVLNLTTANISNVFLTRIAHDDSLIGDGTATNPLTISQNIDGGSAITDWGSDSDLSGIFEGFPEYLDAGGP